MHINYWIMEGKAERVNFARHSLGAHCAPAEENMTDQLMPKEEFFKALQAARTPAHSSGHPVQQRLESW